MTSMEPIRGETFAFLDVGTRAINKRDGQQGLFDIAEVIKQKEKKIATRENWELRAALRLLQ